MRLGYKIHEVPIEYSPRSMEEGKKIRAWHGIEAILRLASFRFMPMNRLLGPTRAAEARVNREDRTEPRVEVFVPAKWKRDRAGVESGNGIASPQPA